MLRFRAPDEPVASQSFRQRTKAAGEAVRKIVIDERRAPGSKEFKPVWTSFKAHFLKAQRDKCGYCELPLPVHPGDVEHFAPKAELQDLPDDRADWGREDEKGTYGVSGRKSRKLSDYGYWWLAYRWSNYLAACNRCNSGWKRNYFPVKARSRSSPPSEADPFEPLLLHPYGELDPADHLKFGNFGQVEPWQDSPVGRATIDVCGLDRPSLIQARKSKALKAHHLVKQYHRRRTTDDDRKRILKDFILLGAEAEPGAGMVRSIFVQRLRQSVGLSWEDILGKVVMGLLQDWTDEFFEVRDSALGVLYHDRLAPATYVPGDLARLLVVVDAAIADRPDPDQLVDVPVPVRLEVRILTGSELAETLQGPDAGVAAALDEGRWLKTRPGWDPRA